MKTIKQHKAEATLRVRMNYPEGIMTRAEWIRLKHSQGRTVKQETKPRVRFNRIKYNRMDWEEQKEYEKKCDERVVCYNLYEEDGRFYEITKAEYDYFNSL